MFTCYLHVKNKAGEAEILHSDTVWVWECQSQDKIRGDVMEYKVQFWANARMCAPLLLKRKPWRHGQSLEFFPPCGGKPVSGPQTQSYLQPFLFLTALNIIPASDFKMPAGHSLLFRPSFLMWWVACGHKTSGEVGKTLLPDLFIQFTVGSLGSQKQTVDDLAW